jgi:hypothetical protein
LDGYTSVPKGLASRGKTLQMPCEMNGSVTNLRPLPSKAIRNLRTFPYFILSNSPIDPQKQLFCLKNQSSIIVKEISKLT